MSTTGALQGLGTVLMADAGLKAWARQHLDHALHLVNGNRPTQVVVDHKLPALVIEMGAGDSEEQIHGHEMAAVTELQGVIVWQEQDEDAAFVQRIALPDLIAKALMADRSLGGRVDGAWLQSWEPDRGANHPLNVFRFIVAAEYAIDNVGA